MNNLVIDNIKAKEIIEKNLSLMQTVFELIKESVKIPGGNPSEVSILLFSNSTPNKPKLDNLLTLGGVDATTVVMGEHQIPTDIAKYDIENSNYYKKNWQTGEESKTLPEHALLPLIFIANTVAEWSDEGNKSLDIGEIFNSRKNNEAMLEFILIRHAFTHRGSVLCFPQTGHGKKNYQALKQFLNQKLTITELTAGQRLGSVPYYKYVELFEAIIKLLT